MSNVVSFQDAKKALSPHSYGRAFCLDCKHEWITVVLLGTIWLECPACGLTRGRLRYQHEYEGPHWNCACGNDLFYVMESKVYCPNCGVVQYGL